MACSSVLLQEPGIYLKRSAFNQDPAFIWDLAFVRSFRIVGSIKSSRCTAHINEYNFLYAVQVSWVMS